MSDFEEGWQAYLAKRGLNEDDLSHETGEFSEHLDAYQASLDEQRARRQQPQLRPQDQRERDIQKAQEAKASVIAELEALEGNRPTSWNLASPEHWTWEATQREIAARLRVAEVGIRRAEAGSPFSGLTDEQVLEKKAASLDRWEEIQAQIRPTLNQPVSQVPYKIKRLRKESAALLDEATQVDAELFLRGEERGEQALVEFQIQRRLDEEEAIRETRKASKAFEEARERLASFKARPGFTSHRDQVIAQLDFEDAQKHSREVSEKYAGKLPRNYGYTYAPMAVR